MAADPDKHKGDKGNFYLAEANKHKGYNDAIHPDGQKQSRLSSNLGTDNPIDREAIHLLRWTPLSSLWPLLSRLCIHCCAAWFLMIVTNGPTSSTLFALPSALERNVKKPRCSTEASNIGQGFGSKNGASS